MAASFTDAGLSGGLPLEQRPGLLSALDALGKGDVLIVANRNRLGRDVLNVAMFERLAERDRFATSDSRNQPLSPARSSSSPAVRGLSAESVGLEAGQPSTPHQTG